MQIQVLLFGIIRDIVGQNKLDVAISDDMTVEQFRTQLIDQYSELINYSFAVAVNEAYAESNTQLNDNDIVALIPPVSGG